jgi:hypothetical protein
MLLCIFHWSDVMGKLYLHEDAAFLSLVYCQLRKKIMWYLINVHDTSHWEKPYKSISDQLQTFYIYDGKS